nr:uncharacterized mitochondrial protein AtMg00810-like [Tanacetum cinerariifolium]
GINLIVVQVKLELPDNDLLSLWTQDLLFSSSSKDSPDDGFNPSREDEKKEAEDPGNEDNEVLSIGEPRVSQKKDSNVNSTNNINTVSPTANAAGIKDNDIDENIVYGCANDLNMPNLKEIVYSDEDEDVGAEADMTNLDTNILVNGLKSAFLYGKIEEEVYVYQPLGFEDLKFPDRVYKNLGYLKGQPKLGLWYPKDSPFDLEAYTNSGYASDSVDKKSTTGDETVHEESGDRVERVATTAASLDAEQDNGTRNRTQSTAIPNEPIPQGTGSGGSLSILGKISSDADFTEMVDFLNANPIKYALT